MTTADSPMHYASFWKRFYAYGYDSMLLLLVGIALRYLLGVRDPIFVHFDEFYTKANAGDGDAQVVLASGLLTWLNDVLLSATLLSVPYNILLVVGRWQATLGKRFCGIKVVTGEGARVGFWQSAARHMVSGLSMLMAFMGFVPIFFTKEKTALHDMVCNTRVVYANSAAK